MKEFRVARREERDREREKERERERSGWKEKLVISRK